MWVWCLQQHVCLDQVTADRQYILEFQTHVREPSLYGDDAIVCAPTVGLPFRGAPLLLPVDIHVSLTRKCSSLLLDMSALCLMLQISFPVLLAASILADCFRPVQVSWPLHGGCMRGYVL